MSATSQTLDYSGSAVYDDSTSVASSSNIQMELLSSNKASHNSSANNDGAYNSDDGDARHQSKKPEKKEHEKVVQVFIFVSFSLKI